MNNYDNTVVEEYKRLLILLKFINLEDDLSIAVNGRDIIVTKWNRESEIKKLILPYGITALSDGCFSGSCLTDVFISSSIDKVGYGCFANCLDLQRIILHRSQRVLEAPLSLSNRAVFTYRD